MRTHLPLATAVAVSTLLLAGCAGTPEPQSSVAAAANVEDCDPTESKLIATYGPTQEEAAQYALEQMNAEYPDLDVTLNQLQVATYDEFTQAVVGDIAVGKRPDLITSGLGQMRFWVEQYEPRPIDVDALADTYQRQFLSAGTVDGEVYLAPAQVAIPFLAVNQTALDAADAGDAEDIRTYDDLIAAAKKVSAMTGKPSVTIGTNNIPDWLSQGFVQGAGGTYITADGTAGFGDEIGVEAVSLWADLKAENLELGIVMDADSQAAFYSGQAQFVITSSSAIASFKKNIGEAFEWAAVDLPSVNGERGPLPSGGNGWIVLSDDACRAAFANVMLSHLLSKEAVLLASGTSFSYIPVDSAAAEELLESDAATQQTTYAWSYDRELTPWGGWKGEITQQVVDIFRTMSQQLQAGADPEPTVQTAVDAINALVAE